ncbi:MAG: HEPN domain-containing protein [Nitrososphaeria archaeon]
MRNREMAIDYMERALRCLEEAELAFSKEDYAGTVRRSQESLELAVKSILRFSGIEYPREHDVSLILGAERDRLPSCITNHLEEITQLSSELASLRGPAMYGYEREGIPARKAFKREYALEILINVKKFVGAMKNAFDNVFKVT